MVGIVTLALVLAMGAQAGPPTAPSGADVSLVLTEQLQTYREGILDPQARLEERRRLLQLLLAFDAPEADALVVELLGFSGRPEVVRTTCMELASRGRSDPTRLKSAFVAPLLTLLGSTTDEIRVGAARALAEFQDSQVTIRLGKVAADSQAGMPTRLAAVQALSVNAQEQEVVEQLVGLLNLSVPEISERVAAALEPIAPQGFADDPVKWNEWWREKKDMGREAWLAEQVRVYRERTRRLSADLATTRGERDRDQSAAVHRVRELQRELLRGLSPEQREAKLVEWIDDPLPLIKLAALAIVTSRMADEGKRPEGDLLAALLRLVRHESAAMRREALIVLQNLRDRAVVEAVLAQLERETDPATRLAMLDALGKLADPSAVPALIREIAADAADMATVRDAANALAQIALRPEAKHELGAATVPLRERYRKLPAEQPDVRAAVLTAMAGVGDNSFISDFLEATESDNPVILQPALRGLLALQDRSKMGRVRVLAAHEDPRVRLAAVQALSVLGGEPADLDALQSRLTSTESNELVKEAAWRGWREFIGKRSWNDRIRATDRLRETPELEIEYLKELLTGLAATENHKSAIDDTRERLISLLTSSGKHSEAVPYLQELYESCIARGDARSWPVGLRWLDAVLQSPAQQGLADLIVQLCTNTDDPAQRSKVVETVRNYVDSPAIAADVDRSRRLMADLGAVDASRIGDGWKDLLDSLNSRIKTAAAGGPAG